MRNKNFPPAHHLRQRHSLVFLPILHGFLGVDEDDKVLRLALVVHFGLTGVSAHVARSLAFFDLSGGDCGGGSLESDCDMAVDLDDSLHNLVCNVNQTILHAKDAVVTRVVSKQQPERQ